jgi:uncharacterized protein YuzE
MAYPTVTYDPESDILLVEFSNAPIARTREAGSVWINVDEAADGSIVAVEIVNASAGIDLRYVPRREEIEPHIRRLNLPVTV